MQIVGGELTLSSGDLLGHLNCRYLTELDLKVVNGELQKPKIWDPVLETLRNGEHSMNVGSSSI